MTVESSTGPSQRLVWQTRIAAAAVIIIGVLVLIGSVLDIRMAKTAPEFAPILPLGAVGVIAAGIALWLKTHRQAPALQAVLAQLAAAGTTVLGILLLVNWFMRRTGGPGLGDGVEEPGMHAGLANAVNLLLTGLALLLLDVRRAFRFAEALALCAGLIALLELAGYAYSAQALYGSDVYAELSIQGAVAFGILSLGVLFARPERGLMALAMSDTAGGVLVRRILPVAVGLPLVLGWLRLAGEHANIFTPAFGTALFALAVTFLFATAIWWAAVLLYRKELAQHSAEREVRESLRAAQQAEAKFRGLWEAAPDGVVIVGSDGVIRLANRQSARMFGYEPEQLVGQNIEILVPERFRPAHVLHRGDYAAKPRSRSMGPGLDLHGRRKDGSEIPIEISLSPLYLQGEAMLVMSIIRDISERRRVEETIRRNEQLLRQVLQLLPVSVCVLDHEGQLLSSNPASTAIWGGEKNLNLHCLAHYKGWLADSHVPIQAEDWPVARAIQRGEITINETIEVELRDAKHKVLLCSAIPLTEPNGKITGAIMVHQDITEQRTVQQQIQDLNTALQKRAQELESANKELEAFAYSVSHDLRTPLRAMDGFSQILIDRYGSAMAPEPRRYLDIVRQSAMRMSRLIEDLLAFSRLGRQALRKQRINMNDLVRHCLDELRADTEGRNINLTAPPLPDAFGDLGMLKQVVLNLISNALKFTSKREEAVIEIGSRPEANSMNTYFIKDNGAGFDMAHAEKLFGVFQRLHTVEEYPGTGVGLAIVQRIVVRHGGRVWAEAAVDQGATFYFSLEAPQ